MTSDLTARLAKEKFVSLTTYKKNGDAVASPMWIARDGDALVMWTPAETWKVRRVRRDPRVRLSACGRTGRVDIRQPALTGQAELIDDDREVLRIESIIKRKYGLVYRLMTVVETIAARGRKPRVGLRISALRPA
ncbi:PPOX class F420-dependent oxidoreductase [Mycobacterium sp. URHB0021]